MARVVAPAISTPNYHSPDAVTARPLGGGITTTIPARPVVPMGGGLSELGETVAPAATKTQETLAPAPRSSRASIARRQKFADAVMGKAMDTSPTVSGNILEPLLRNVVPGAIGGWMQYNANQEEQAGQDAATQAYQKLFAGGKQPTNEELANFLGTQEYATEGQQSVGGAYLTAGLKDNEIWSPMSSQQKKAYGLTEDTPAEINDKGQVRVLKDSGINIDVGDVGFDKQLGKDIATAYGDALKQGYNAAGTKAGVQQLRQLMQRSGSGTVSGVATLMAPYVPEGLLPEGTDDATAAQAIVSSMIPKQRVAGSGTTSDYDAKQFAASLPSLWNKPGANAIIFDTMEAYADWQMAVANAVTEIGSSDTIKNKAKAINDAIRQLPDPFARWKQYQGGAAPDTGGGGGTEETVDDLSQVHEGDVVDDGSGVPKIMRNGQLVPYTGN